MNLIIGQKYIVVAKAHNEEDMFSSLWEVGDIVEVVTKEEVLANASYISQYDPGPFIKCVKSRSNIVVGRYYLAGTPVLKLIAGYESPLWRVLTGEEIE